MINAKKEMTILKENITKSKKEMIDSKNGLNVNTPETKREMGKKNHRIQKGCKKKISDGNEGVRKHISDINKCLHRPQEGFTKP